MFNTIRAFLKERRWMVKDPVCGMEVDEKNVTDKFEYLDATHYFCSSGCKAAFEQDPARYTEGTSAKSDHH